MAVETVPMEEVSLSSLMTDEKPEVQETEPKVERDRDEQGRFVAKEQPKEEVKTEPEVKTEATTPPEPKDDAQVPSWRLREVREAREAAERRAEEASRQAYAVQQQMAEMRRQLESLQKPKQEPVDFFQNPDEAFNQRVGPIQSDIEKFKSDLRLEFSRELAVIKHGEQTVSEVEAAVAKAMQSNHPDMPALSARMRVSSNPVAEAIKWHQQNKLMESTGGNLETYKQKVLEEAMKDPAFQAKVLEATRSTAQAKPSTIQIPPSLNKAAGSGQTEVDDADMSNEGLFRHAMGSRR